MNMLEHILFFKAPPIRKDFSRMPKRGANYGTVQPRVLAYLKEHPDSTPNDMREALGLNRYSVDRALRKLKEDRLVKITKRAVQHGSERSPAKWRAV